MSAVSTHMLIYVIILFHLTFLLLSNFCLLRCVGDQIKKMILYAVEQAIKDARSLLAQEVLS